MAKSKKNPSNEEVKKEDLKFKDEESGTVYEVVKPTLRYKGKVYKAEEALKEAEVLAHLVSVNSGVIAIVSKKGGE